MIAEKPPLPSPPPQGGRGQGACAENAASVLRTFRHFSYDAGAAGEDRPRAVAVETPIEIAYGGQPFAVMMGTPADLEDFAYGFSLTEGIVESAQEIRAVETSLEPEAARLSVTLTGERLRMHLARRRAVAGRTGCGVCGVEDLQHLPRAAARARKMRPPSPHAVGKAIAALEGLQPLNAATRAVHAAAWVEADGTIALVREDVGRHNALDKCIGALLRQEIAAGEGFFVVTSRCSYEMVTKAAAYGAGALVAVSAPTSLALKAARHAGVALICIARRDGALVFEPFGDPS